MPPLRARRGDVELLAHEFCRSFGAANGKPDIVLTDEAIALLRAQRWPGNVRQLVNLIERLVVLSDASVITEDDIRRELDPTTPFSTQLSSAGSFAAAGSTTSTGAPSSSVVPLSEEVRAAERRALEKALRHTKGNRTLAARILGVSRATLYNKLGEHGLG
jgi:two-component system response regulator AtoC